MQVSPLEPTLLDVTLLALTSEGTLHIFSGLIVLLVDVGGVTLQLLDLI